VAVQPEQGRKWLTDSRLFILGFVLLAVLLYPGFISPDSKRQILEGRSGVYGDWHPPVVTFLWSIADRFFIAGTFGILLLHLSLFWWGLCSFTTGLWSSKGRWLPFLICFYPPIFGIEGAIWKDLLMVGALAVALATMKKPPSKKWSAVFWAAIFVGTASRYNAWVAAIPLIFIWAHRWKRWRRLGMTAAMSIVLLVTTVLANSLLADKKEQPWQSLAIHDVFGVAAATNQPLKPAWCSECPTYSAEKIGTHHQAFWWEGTLRKIKVRLPESKADLDALRSQWKEMVFSNPGGYLRHRSDTFFFMLAITMDPWGATYYQLPKRKHIFRQLNHNHQLNLVQTKIQSWLYEVRTSLFFRPWIYLLLALILLVVNWRWRLGRGEITALLLSGVGCELSLFIMAPSSDYRYSLWLIITTVIAGAVMGADHRSSRLSRTSSD